MKDDAPPIDLVLSALSIERTDATQYSARCPAHDDSTASLSIGVKPDGAVGLHCHTGCDTAAVCAALGITTGDLFPRKGKAASKRRAKPCKAKRTAKVAVISDAELDEAWEAAKNLGPPSLSGFKLAAVYPYRDANGKVFVYRARYESKSGEKQIKPFHHDGNQWVLKEPKAPRAGKPLYRLPEILADDSPIFVVEGEKCADALAALGIAATTSGAAKSANKADWSSLAGRACVIWPDNDDPGERYAADVAKLLGAIGCDVRTIDLAALDLPGEGDDAADWLTTNPNATAADVLALPTIEQEDGSGICLLRADNLESEAPDFIWHEWIPRQMLTLIAGQGGDGKTTLALTIGAAVTTGGRLPDGTSAAKGSVVMWAGEDAITKTILPRLEETGADRSRFYFVTGEDRDFDPSTDMEALEQAVRKIGDVALIIIDPIASAVSGDSHKNNEVRRGLRPVLVLAEKSGAAIIGITHFSKNSGGRRTNERVLGSVAFSAVARAVLATARNELTGECRIVRSKNNVGPTGDGFAYSLVTSEREFKGRATRVSKIVWGDALYGRADDLLEEVEAKRSKRDVAADWLCAVLHNGPVPQKEIEAKAGAEGIAWATVRRAANEIGVRAEREGLAGKGKGAGRSMWVLPTAKYR